MSRRILAPHKEQDGWRYIRVPLLDEPIGEGMWKQNDDGSFSYTDDTPGSRVISSRRVEQAVETWDYLQRCKEEGLCAIAFPFPSGIAWDVFAPGRSPVGRERKAYPLREAYHRYKAGA